MASTSATFASLLSPQHTHSQLSTPSPQILPTFSTSLSFSSRPTHGHRLITARSFYGGGNGSNNNSRRTGGGGGGGGKGRKWYRVPSNLPSNKSDGDDNDDRNDDGNRDPWIEVISWKPRVVIYHNFLSRDECEYLINLAKPHMRKSTVVDDNTGEDIDSRERTSSGTFLYRSQDETIREIEKKIADFTFIPVEHGEGLQILHYEVGQKYEPHYDYFQNEVNYPKKGGNRFATVLMYLSDVEEGGETVFPNAEGNFSSVPWWNKLSECGKGGLSIKPKMGDALLFYSANPDGTFDSSSLHGGCPVIRGNKWSSTKWLHFNEYED